MMNLYIPLLQTFAAFSTGLVDWARALLFTLVLQPLQTIGNWKSFPHIVPRVITIDSNASTAFNAPRSDLVLYDSTPLSLVAIGNPTSPPIHVKIIEALGSLNPFNANLVIPPAAYLVFAFLLSATISSYFVVRSRILFLRRVQTSDSDSIVDTIDLSCESLSPDAFSDVDADALLEFEGIPIELTDLDLVRCLATPDVTTEFSSAPLPALEETVDEINADDSTSFANTTLPPLNNSSDFDASASLVSPASNSTLLSDNDYDISVLLPIAERDAILDRALEQAIQLVGEDSSIQEEDEDEIFNYEIMKAAMVHNELDLLPIVERDAILDRALEDAIRQIGGNIAVLDESDEEFNYEGMKAAFKHEDEFPALLPLAERDAILDRALESAISQVRPNVFITEDSDDEVFDYVRMKAALEEGRVL